MTDDLRAALISCQRILGKLQLFEASTTTSSLRRERVVPRYADSRIPSGVRSNSRLTTEQVPDKNFSLWGYYQWHMARAQKREDIDELVRLAGQATRDWDIRTGAVRVSLHESHEAAVRELLSDHTGKPSDEIAWRLGVPEKWVRRQRIVNGHDPDLGGVRKVGPRVAQVIALRKQGIKQRVIAEELGITPGRVSQILNGTGT